MQMWVFADIKDGPHLRKASASAAEQSRRAGMKHTLIITQTSSSRSTHTQVCFSKKNVFFPPQHSVLNASPWQVCLKAALLESRENSLLVRKLISPPHHHHPLSLVIINVTPPQPSSLSARRLRCYRVAPHLMAPSTRRWKDVSGYK